ncbi:GH25 family lysozyme [Saccharopolyspora griseoalba]|uniref:GH25 family lysozyme n=1 Tax=Saccharopolyspora griseoalba TaxID=1431848 RepID=A0ABW2LRX2_9PSEU
MKPETPDEPRTPENDDHAASPKHAATDRGWHATAQRADEALRAGVDRVRPVTDRVGQWLAPVLQRLVQWLSPLFERIGRAPAVRRFRERVAPHVAAIQDKLPEGSRSRSMQVGAGVAAVGVVGLIIGGVATSGGEQTSYEEAAMAAPMKSAQHAAPEQPDAPKTPAETNSPAENKAEAEKPEAPAPLGPPVEGIDVSNHNGPIDWKQVAASGKKFTFVLASDGIDFTSPTYDEQYHGAKDAGLIAGAYHFARPGDSSGVDQANRFLDVADYKNDGKTLPPVLDLEVDPNSGGCYGMSVEQMHKWTDEFNNTVEERTGQKPIIYANPSFWSQCMGSTDAYSDHALWLASYEVDSPSVPSGFGDWNFWQYTDKGSVPGISGSTDLNQFKQGQARLEQLAS